jgi:glycerate 2-kinase
MLLAAPDKFRGTASAEQVSAAIARGASPLGWSVHQLPLADGGEGLLDALDALGGTRETLLVEGPLGDPVEAEWLRVGGVAVIEMAQASGLELAGGHDGNDPVLASTRGTGALIVAAARALSDGARSTPSATPSGGGTVPGDPEGPPTIVVGLGGSATTDGGAGAVDVIQEAGGLDGVELVGACDVGVRFIEAARRFGPQKGAQPAQIPILEARLEQVAARYERQYGIDVRAVTGAGAAGGFGGGLVALGGQLRSGYEVVTELLGFPDLLSASQLVVTGEGSFDSTSLMGKVVGSVLRDASALGVQVVVIAGQVSPEAAAAAERSGARVVSLSERFGVERSMSDTVRCIELAVAEVVGGVASTGRP